MSQLSFIAVSDRSEILHALEASGHVELIETFADGGQLPDAIRRRRPDGILLQLGGDAARALTILEQIPAPRPYLLVAGPDESQLILEAMRLGVHEYITLSQPIEAQVSNALDRILLATQTETARSEAPLIAVLGSKGGVGATFVCTQLALRLAGADEPVALVDLNLHHGDCALYLDLEPSYTLSDVARRDTDSLDAAFLATVMASHASGLRLLAAPERLEDAEAIAAVSIEHTLDILRHEYAWSLVDLPRTWDERTLRVLERASMILVVTLPEIPALHHARQYMDVMQRLGHSAEKVKVVLNRADKNAAISPGDLADFLGRKPDLTLPNDFRGAQACVNGGLTLSSEGKRGGLGDAFDQCARLVRGWGGADPASAVPAGSKGLRRLLRRFGRGSA